MRSLIAALLLCGAAWAQPVNPPPAILKGNPPGGAGGACSATAEIGYLDADGNIITCPSGTSVWTVTGSGGGTPGGTTTALQNNTGTAFGGDASIASLSLSALSAPAAPTVGHVGTAGSTHYGYTIEWYTTTGASAGSAETVITNGNAVLDETNYVTITQNGSCPATVMGFLIFRTTGPDTGLLGTAACGDTYNDQGGISTPGGPLSEDSNPGLGASRLVIGPSFGMGATLVSDGSYLYIYGADLSTVGTLVANLGDDAANTQSLSDNSTKVATTAYADRAAIHTNGATFTASGCGNGTLVGGSTAGKFTSGDAGGSCSITVTMGSSATAANGWSCQIQDLSAPSKVWGQTASDATTATFLSPGVTTSTNVVSWFCIGY